MESLDLKTIIDGGGLGVLVLVVILNFLKDKAYNKTLNNHLGHIDKSLNRLATQQEISNEHSKRLTDVLDNNAKLFGRVEGIIQNCKR